MDGNLDGNVGVESTRERNSRHYVSRPVQGVHEGVISGSDIPREAVPNGRNVLAGICLQVRRNENILDVAYIGSGACGRGVVGNDVRSSDL